MTNPASAAAAPPPAPVTAAADAVDPPPGATPVTRAAAAHVPSSSSKREREQGASGEGGSGNGGMQQQQQNSAGANAGAEDAEGPFGRGKRRRSKKPLTPEVLLRKEVHASAKRQDARAALTAFDAYLELLRRENEAARERASAAAAAAAAGAEAPATQEREEGGSEPAPYYHSLHWDAESSPVHLSSDVRNSLLYLCAGGDAWDAELAGPEARDRRRAASGSTAALVAAAAAAAAPPSSASSPSSPLPAEELARRGREIFDRTTVRLADVERPLVGRAADGSAVAAAAAAAAAPSAVADANGSSSAISFPPPSAAAAQQLSADGEMVYTALARMAARAGDPRGSLAAAREAVARGYPPRLRCFSPALLAFAVEGDAASAFAVEREAREEHGLEMTEPELGFLASAAAAANSGGGGGGGEGGGRGQGGGGGGAPSSSALRVPFEAVEAAVLAVLTREHGRLQRETIAALEAYFASLGGLGGPEPGPGAEPGAEGGKETTAEARRQWRVGRARVDPATGRVLVPSFLSSSSSPCSAAAAAGTSPPPPPPPPFAASSPSKPDFFAPDALGPVDLEPHEWAAFSEGVAALARARERSPAGAFDAFAAWCELNGPFDAVVDGANVALFGQNWAHGDFSFAQLEAVVEELKRRLGPGSKTLVVLHRSRLAAPPARDADGRRVLRSLAAEAAAVATDPSSCAPSATAPQPLPAQALLYAAPHGSNDDWYWLHAAVAAGARGLVVSNDEMRDHVFQLLSPRFAARWKDRHQARYSFQGNYHPGSSALYPIANGGGGGGSGGCGVSARLLLPPPFSECSQRLPRTGAWLFPRAVAAAAAAEEGGDERREGGEGGEGDDPDEWLCCSPIA